MGPADDACRKKCEELQFCLEKADELKSNRERQQVDEEEPDALPCPLGKVAVFQVADTAIAAAGRHRMGSRSEHSSPCHHLVLPERWSNSCAGAEHCYLATSAGFVTEVAPRTFLQGEESSICKQAPALCSCLGVC